MRLGLGVTALARSIKSGGVDGIGHYTNQLFTRIGERRQVHLSSVSFGHLVPGLGLDQGIICTRFAPAIACSVMTGLPFLGSSRMRAQLDLFHATDHYIPRLDGVPVVATLHDAIPLEHPEWVSLRYRLMISPVFKLSAKWAERIITVSEYSRRQVIQYFEVEAGKVSVIPNGVDIRWFNEVDAERLMSLKVRYGLERNYILSVGTLQPRKNMGRLIDAYRRLPKELKENFDLLIVGRFGWGDDGLLARISSQSASGRVRWLKYLPDDELEALVKGASCLAQPSLAEGFGLPVLEGFAAGVAVLTSNVTALPEVAGDAAVLVNPYEVDSIAVGLQCILEDKELVSRLRLKGGERAKLFSWDRTVDETLKVYRSIA
jgi:glycosyltransferase involved in cell wall biosynthesis